MEDGLQNYHVFYRKNVTRQAKCDTNVCNAILTSIEQNIYE